MQNPSYESPLSFPCFFTKFACIFFPSHKHNSECSCFLFNCNPYPTFPTLFPLFMKTFSQIAALHAVYTLTLRSLFSLRQHPHNAPLRIHYNNTPSSPSLLQILSYWSFSLHTLEHVSVIRNTVFPKKHRRPTLHACGFS